MVVFLGRLQRHLRGLQPFMMDGGGNNQARLVSSSTSVIPHLEGLGMLDRRRVMSLYR